MHDIMYILRYIYSKAIKNNCAMVFTLFTAIHEPKNTIVSCELYLVSEIKFHILIQNARKVKIMQVLVIGICSTR